MWDGTGSKGLELDFDFFSIHDFIAQGLRFRREVEDCVSVSVWVCVCVGECMCV